MTTHTGGRWGKLCGAAAAVAMLAGDGRAEAADGSDLPPPVRVVYFTTADRQPPSTREERLGRVMKEVQRFYRDGMRNAGYTNRTFNLETDAAGRLKLHEVKAKGPMTDYGRNAWGKVRNEVRLAMASRGIDIDRETIVIFQTLLKWEGVRAIEIGPYVGSGDHLHGTAWVYDDDKLDPDLLSSKAPGGYYNRPCSVGQFNSHYIGGVAHELGHAFGLPHICETPSQTGRGRALMGGGNHTYGQERRGEGKGSFLHPLSALLLSRIRPFAGPRPDVRRDPRLRLTGFGAIAEPGAMTVTGRIECAVSTVGVGAYDDLKRIESDYDARGWLGTLHPDGRFEVRIGDTRQDASQLRLVFVHANGAKSFVPIDYEADERRLADTGAMEAAVLRTQMNRLFMDRDTNAMAVLARDLSARDRLPADLPLRAGNLLARLDPPPPELLADVPASRSHAPLSRLQLSQASVGWGEPLRDGVPQDSAGLVWMTCGGRFYADGLFAHAPARHALDLAPGWKSLRTDYGLQDGANGSVVFVVKGDGRELFRSPVIRDHQPRTLDLSVAGVRKLELVVENGGDGNNSDWGLWLSPELRR